MVIEFTKLGEPFPVEDVEWRIAQCGRTRTGGVWARCLAYVTNRAIQNRLDGVCGPSNWCNEFKDAPGGGVLCGISIRVDTGEWVTKWDGAEQTDIEAVKGGLSSAMKRAAVQWGIGRYLYDLPEGWATCSTDEKEFPLRGYDKKENLRFSWRPPEIPAWALPGGSGKPTEPIAPPSKSLLKGNAAKAAVQAFRARIGAAKSEVDLRGVAAEIKLTPLSDEDKSDLRDLFSVRLKEFHEAGADFADPVVAAGFEAGREPGAEG